MVAYEMMMVVSIKQKNKASVNMYRFLVTVCAQWGGWCLHILGNCMWPAEGEGGENINCML